jgi:hypothetical protein
MNSLLRVLMAVIGVATATIALKKSVEKLANVI